MTLTEVAASAAARAFFYPSVLWNIARNRMQSDWAWFNMITEHVVLGALPFQSMLDEFKDQGIKAVVTLNEDFEVFITAKQYEEYGFSHLHIPTVDFLFSPPVVDLHRGTDFIHEHASRGERTYVHCKAGRGRSTTLVLCYLIKHHSMAPDAAYDFVRSKRPQVCLAPGQWAAVCDFYASCHPGSNPAQPAQPCPDAGIETPNAQQPLLPPAFLSAASPAADHSTPPDGLARAQSPAQQDSTTGHAQLGERGRCSAARASSAAAPEAACQPELPYTLASGCCSQPLTGSMDEHAFSTGPACQPHEAPHRKRRLGDDACASMHESDPAACLGHAAELRDSGRFKRQGVISTDAASPIMHSLADAGAVGSPNPSASPSHESTDTQHQPDSLEAYPHEDAHMQCSEEVQDPSEPSNMHATMASTGHQRIDDYCWTALRSDGSLESLHSLHTSTSF